MIACGSSSTDPPRRYLCPVVAGNGIIRSVVRTSAFDPERPLQMDMTETCRLDEAKDRREVPYVHSGSGQHR